MLDTEVISVANDKKGPVVMVACDILTAIHFMEWKCWYDWKSYD